MRKYRIMTKILLVLAVPFACAICSCEKVDPDGPDPNNPRREIRLDNKEEIVADKISDVFGKKVFSYFVRQSEGNVLLSPMNLSAGLGILANELDQNGTTRIMEAMGLGMEDLKTLGYVHKHTGYFSELDQKTYVFRLNPLWLDAGCFTNLSESVVSNMKENYMIDAMEMGAVDGDGGFDVLKAMDDRYYMDSSPFIYTETGDSENKLRQISALWVRSLWQEGFRKWFTSKQTFHNASGSKSTVDMMTTGLMTEYITDDDYIAVSMPFGNKAFSMLVILPLADKKVHDILDNLDYEKLRILAKCKDGQDVGVKKDFLNISFPKFSIENKLDMDGLLKYLGVVKDGEYEGFTGLLGDSGIKSSLSNSVHMASIEVDENGINLNGMSVDSNAPEEGALGEEKFTVDREFMFIVIEQSTGIPLYMGRVSEL